MRQPSQNLPTPPPCDLCGSTQADFILTTPRLEGPLVRCANCGLYYVSPLEPATGLNHFNDPAPSSSPARTSDSEQAAEEMARLSLRARELSLVEPAVEEAEGKWRALAAQERLADLLRVTKGTPAGKRLLEIGSSTGEFLAAAAQTFSAIGIEADRGSCTVAQARGLTCFNGTLFDAAFPDASFDVVVLYHVIEHFPSPQKVLREIHRILAPQGWLVLETPDIDNFWFKLLGARWRQFIPDHCFFFDPETITRGCVEKGFEIVTIQSVGKAMSLRLFISRLGRYNKSLGQALAWCSKKLRLDNLTVQLNLGDVLRLYAQKK